MSLIRQSIWAAAAAITLAVSRFAFTAIIARRLSVAAFGQFAYGQWIVDLAFLVCSLGATGVAARYLAEFRHDAGLSSAIARLWFPFAIGLPGLAGIAGLAGVWLTGIRLDAFAAAALMTWAIANGLWAMQTAALTGLQRFDLICGANGTAAALMVVGAMVIPLDAGQPGPVFGLMAASAAAAAAVGLRPTVHVARVAPARIERALLQDIHRYAINIWVTALLWGLVWSRGEMPIVHARLGDEGVARYAAVLTLFGGAIQGVMLAVTGVAPHLTRLWGEGAQTQAIDLARRLMDLQLVLCGLAALLLMFFGPELLLLAFGSAYRGESGTLAILSIGMLAMAVSSQGHLLQITTNARFNRNSTLVGTALLFVMAAWLVASEGLFGAALSRAVTMVLLAAVTLYAARIRWGRHAWSGWNVLATSLLLASCAAIVHFRSGMDWPMRAAAACSAAFLLVLAVRDTQGRTQIHSICSRMFWSLFAKRRAP